jgi:hypothetical protein
MNTEQLVAKQVKHQFDQKSKEVLFDVISLEDHFDGLLIHTSDIIYIEEGELVNGYVKVGDVNFESAVSKEFVEEEAALGMTYKEAEKLLKEGKLIALPEWGGFWFYNYRNEDILVLTKEGEITDTPWEICKLRNDWQVVEANNEQYILVRDYFDKDYGFTPKPTADILEIEVTAETLNDNPELVDAGIKVGETITVDAVEPIEEVIPVKVVKKKTKK